MYNYNETLLRTNLIEMFRQGYDHYDSRKNSKYITKQDLELLAYIKKQSMVDWTVLLINFKYEQYVWRFYPALKDPKIRTFSQQLELSNRNNGLPDNVIFIVYLVNRTICFNKRVKYFFFITHWNQRIFLYYDRYYRYLYNEKKFNKKRKVLPKRNSYKVHFIPCIYHRQLTGNRIQRNYLRY